MATGPAGCQLSVLVLGDGSCAAGVRVPQTQAESDAQSAIAAQHQAGQKETHAESDADSG